MDESPEIRESIERSVDRLISVPQEDWGTWIVGVLEGLEARVAQEGREEAFEQALNEVQQFMERRLLRRIEREDDS